MTPTRIDDALLDAFRILPYQQQPTDNGMLFTWFTQADEAGEIEISGGDLGSPIVLSSSPEFMPRLSYVEPELNNAANNGYEIFDGENYKHSVFVEGLAAGTTYDYAVTQSGATFAATVQTAPDEDWSHIRFVAMADSETEPRGRVQIRDWAEGAQAEGSLGRPGDLPVDGAGRQVYLLNQKDGFAQNLRIVGERDPEFVIMPGDLVQGGGYQLGWDEFFRHNAGAFDQTLTERPILPALGNWENFSAVNGGYGISEDFNAVAFARSKYKDYFDMPSNGTDSHQDNYYRIDYGPLTVITLDSSNGEPDVAGSQRGEAGTPDVDTNVNIDAERYRANNDGPESDGTDLSDFNPGSVQAEWLRAQLEDARADGQIIFAQFHHAPYSTGGAHSIPNAGLASEGLDATPSGQAGTPLRQFTPLFDEFGVTAVFAGHTEIAERSLVNPDGKGMGVNFFDVGIAADGMRGTRPIEDGLITNPFSQWTAHNDAGELWQEVTDRNGETYVTLVDGGKHYGHLEANLYKLGDTTAMTFQIAYSFPKLDAEGALIGDTDRRIYDDVQLMTFNDDGTPATQEAVTLVEGDAGRNTLVGTDGADFIIGLAGRDILTGGEGFDTFIYEEITDAGDRITDFTVGEDVIDLSSLLGGLGVDSDDPIGDGFVSFRGRGDDAFVLVDPDGEGAGRARTLIQVEGVDVETLADAANFLF